MIEGIPLWVVLLDYLLGMVMWTLIGRFGMGLFLPADSRVFFSTATTTPTPDRRT